MAKEHGVKPWELRRMTLRDVRRFYAGEVKMPGKKT
jgi:hypothetical protein